MTPRSVTLTVTFILEIANFDLVGEFFLHEHILFKKKTLHVLVSLSAYEFYIRLNQTLTILYKDM